MLLCLDCRTAKTAGLYLVSSKSYSKTSHTHGLFGWIIGGTSLGTDGIGELGGTSLGTGGIGELGGTSLEMYHIVIEYIYP